MTKKRHRFLISLPIAVLVLAVATASGCASPGGLGAPGDAEPIADVPSSAKPSGEPPAAVERKDEDLSVPTPPIEVQQRKLQSRAEPGRDAGTVRTKTAGTDVRGRPSARKKSKSRRKGMGMGGMVATAPPPIWDLSTGNTEAYDRIRENEFIAVTDDPRSTFSIDVDTASYANMRRFLRDGQLPPVDAVRTEELVNYFSYDYQPPRGEAPFAVTTEVSQSPWNPDNRLVHIGIQGKKIHADNVPARNLVFLLDVSGSMRSPDKLPLLKRALRLLVDQLRTQDRVSIVVYAGASGMVLPPTSGANRQDIMSALERLNAGGSTNGASGIRLAYQTAADNFIRGGINRVILATDGDFNVGVTNRGDLTRLIEDKRNSGVFLSVLGLGRGNLKDATMEDLADRGNGNYAYIDSIGEARKVLVEEAGSTLVTIAKDVKIQVEFNPAQVASFRLVGYENRKLAHVDFNDDKKDAGEIGAGHTVTAMYEIVPAGKGRAKGKVDGLKYQQPGAMSKAAGSSELMTVKIRHKEPTGSKSKLLSFAVTDDDLALAKTTDDFRFAAAVAQFAMLLRRSEHRGQGTFADVEKLATAAKGKDPHGHRAEFIRLVQGAARLSSRG